MSPSMKLTIVIDRTEPEGGAPLHVRSELLLETSNHTLFDAALVAVRNAATREFLRRAGPPLRYVPNDPFAGLKAPSPSEPDFGKPVPSDEPPRRGREHVHYTVIVPPEKSGDKNDYHVTEPTMEFSSALDVGNYLSYKLNSVPSLLSQARANEENFAMLRGYKVMRTEDYEREQNIELQAHAEQQAAKE